MFGIGSSVLRFTAVADELMALLIFPKSTMFDICCWICPNALPIPAICPGIADVNAVPRLLIPLAAAFCIPLIAPLTVPSALARPVFDTTLVAWLTADVAELIAESRNPIL
jgi:hypothetical protein